jgi:hypothetical protein
MACAAFAQAYMTMDHPDYSILAARIAVSNLHKQTKKVLPPPWSPVHAAADGGGSVERLLVRRCALVRWRERVCGWLRCGASPGCAGCAWRAVPRSRPTVAARRRGRECGASLLKRGAL